MNCKIFFWWDEKHQHNSSKHHTTFQKTEDAHQSSRSCYRENGGDKSYKKDYDRNRSRDRGEKEKAYGRIKYERSSGSPEKTERYGKNLQRSRSKERQKFNNRHKNFEESHGSQDRHKTRLLSKSSSKSPSRGNKSETDTKHGHFDKRKSENFKKIIYKDLGEENITNHKPISKKLSTENLKLENENKSESDKRNSNIETKKLLREEKPKSSTVIPKDDLENKSDIGFIKNLENNSHHEITLTESHKLSTPRRVALFNDIFGKSPIEYGSTPKNSANTNTFLSDIKGILAKTSEIEVISSATTSPGDYTDIDSATTPINMPIESISCASNTFGKAQHVKKIDKESKSRNEIDDCFIPNSNTEQNFKTIACVDLTNNFEDDIGDEIDFIEIPGLDLCSKKKETKEEDKIKDLQTCDKEETDVTKRKAPNDKFFEAIDLNTTESGTKFNIENCDIVDENQHILIADGCASIDKTNDFNEESDPGGRILNIDGKNSSNTKLPTTDDIQIPSTSNCGSILIDKQDKTLYKIATTEKADELLSKVKGTEKRFIKEAVVIDAIQCGDVVPLENPKENEQKLLSTNKSTNDEVLGLKEHKNESQRNENRESESPIKSLYSQVTLDKTNLIEKSKTFNAENNNLGLKSDMKDSFFEATNVEQFSITESVKILSKDEKIIPYNEKENSLISTNISSIGRKTDISQIINAKSNDKIFLENNQDIEKHNEHSSSLLKKENSIKFTKESGKARSPKDKDDVENDYLKQAKSINREQSDATDENMSTALQEEIGETKTEIPNYLTDQEILGNSTDQPIVETINEVKLQGNEIKLQGNVFSFNVEQETASKLPERFLKDEHSINVYTSEERKILDKNELEAIIKAVEMSTSIKNKTIENAGPFPTPEKDDLAMSQEKLTQNYHEAADSFSEETNPLNNKNSKVIVQSVELLPPIKIIQIKNKSSFCPTDKNISCSLTNEESLDSKENPHEILETFSPANVVENDKVNFALKIEQESSSGLSANVDKEDHYVKIVDLCSPIETDQKEKLLSILQDKNESSVTTNSSEYNKKGTCCSKENLKAIEENDESLLPAKTFATEKEILNTEVLSCISDKTKKNSIVKESLNENRIVAEPLPQKEIDEKTPSTIIEQDITSDETSVFQGKSLTNEILQENSQTVVRCEKTNIAKNLEGISSSSQQIDSSNISKIVSQVDNCVQESKSQNKENSGIISESAEMLQDKAVHIEEKNLVSLKKQQALETLSSKSVDLGLKSFEKENLICDEIDVDEINNVDENISEKVINCKVGENVIQSNPKVAVEKDDENLAYNKRLRTVSNSKEISDKHISENVAIGDHKTIKKEIIPSQSIETSHNDSHDYPENENNSLVLIVSDLDLTDEIEDTSKETETHLKYNLITNDLNIINQNEQQEYSTISSGIKLMIEEVHEKLSTKTALTESTESAQIFETSKQKTQNEDSGTCYKESLSIALTKTSQNEEKESSINSSAKEEFCNEKSSGKPKENSFNKKTFIETTSSEDLKIGTHGVAATNQEEICNILSSEENNTEATKLKPVQTSSKGSCNEATKRSTNLNSEELETATVIRTNEASLTEAEHSKRCHTNEALISETASAKNSKENPPTLEKEKIDPIITKIPVLKPNTNDLNETFADNTHKEKFSDFQQIESEKVTTACTGKSLQAKNILKASHTQVIKPIVDKIHATPEIVSTSNQNEAELHDKPDNEEALYCVNQLIQDKPNASKKINISKCQKDFKIQDCTQINEIENETVNESCKNAVKYTELQEDKHISQIGNCDLVSSTTNELKNFISVNKSGKEFTDEIYETVHNPGEFLDENISLTLQPEALDNSSQMHNLKKTFQKEVEIKEGIVEKNIVNVSSSYKEEHDSTKETTVIIKNTEEIGQTLEEKSLLSEENYKDLQEPSPISVKTIPKSLVNRKEPEVVKLGNSTQNKEEETKIINNESNLRRLEKPNDSESTNKTMQANRSSPVRSRGQPICERKETKMVPKPSSYSQSSHLSMYGVENIDHTSVKKQLATHHHVTSLTEILSMQESTELKTEITHKDRLVINTPDIPIVLQTPATMQQTDKENEKASPSLSLSTDADAIKIICLKKVVTKEINIEGEIVEVVKDIVDSNVIHSKTPNNGTIKQPSIITNKEKYATETAENPRDLALGIPEAALKYDNEEVKDSISLQQTPNLPDSLHILPSIPTALPTPSNFSGIFSKTPSTSAISEDELNKFKKKSVHFSNKPKEYILPAASVLCNVDNLENATKANKKLHWELLENKNELTEIEDDADIDTTDEEQLKIKEEPLENTSNSPKQTKLQNVFNQCLLQKSLPSETDTQTEDESLLNDLRQQKEKYKKPKHLKIHKIKSKKLPKNIKARLKAISMQNINDVVHTEKIVQKPFSTVSSKRPVGRPRKFDNKERISDKLLQHRKRGRKPKEIVESHTYKENQIVLKEDIQNSKFVEADDVERNAETLQPQTCFRKSAKRESNYLKNNNELLGGCDRNIFDISNMENSVKSLSSSVEKLEICDEPCGSKDSFQQRKSLETQTLDSRNKGDSNTSMICHKQYSSEDGTNTCFLAGSNTEAEERVKSETTPILGTENVYLKSLVGNYEVTLKSNEIQDGCGDNDCSSPSKTELLIKEKKLSGLSGHSVKMNSNNALSSLQNRIASDKYITNRSYSGSAENQQETSESSKSLTKHLSKKKFPPKSINNKFKTFISLEDIGINVRPPKVHLSTFRIPKIKKNPEDIIDNSWKLETYEEIKNMEDKKKTQEHKKPKDVQGKVTQEKTHNVENKNKNICQVSFREDVSQDHEDETVQTKLNSTELVLKEDVQLKKENPGKEETKSTKSKFILNFDETKTGRRKLFSPDMYNECDSNVVEESRETKTETKLSETTREQYLNAGKTSETYSAKPRRKSIYLTSQAAKPNNPEAKSAKSSTKPAKNSASQQRWILDSSSDEGSDNVAKKEKLSTTDLRNTTQNSKSAVISKTSVQNQTTNTALKKKETNKPLRLRRKSMYCERTNIQDVISPDDPRAKEEKANSKPSVPVGQETAINKLELPETNAKNCVNHQPTKIVKSFKMLKRSLNTAKVSPTQLKEQTDELFAQKYLPQSITAVKYNSVNEEVNNLITEDGKAKQASEPTETISSIKMRRRRMLAQNLTEDKKNDIDLKLSQEILEKKSDGINLVTNIQQEMQASSSKLCRKSTGNFFSSNNVQSDASNGKDSKNDSREANLKGTSEETNAGSDLQSNRLHRRRQSTNQRNNIDYNKGNNNKNYEEKINDSTMGSGIIPKTDSSTVSIQYQPIQQMLQRNESGACYNNKITNELIAKCNDSLDDNSNLKNKHIAPAKETKNKMLRRKSINKPSVRDDPCAVSDVTTVHVKKDLLERETTQPDTIQLKNIADSTAELANSTDIKKRRKPLSHAQNLKPEITTHQKTQNDQNKLNHSRENQEDSERKPNNSSNMEADSDASVILTKQKAIKLRRKSTTNQRRILDSSSDEEPVNKKPNVITSAAVVALTVVEKPKQRKRVVKVLNTSRDSPNNSTNTSQQSNRQPSPFASPLFNHPIFNNEVSAQSVTLPMTPNQQDDSKLKEIDSKLNELFQSPIYSTDYKNLPSVSQTSNLALSPPSVNDSQPNITIDETIDLNQGNNHSLLNVSQVGETHELNQENERSSLNVSQVNNSSISLNGSQALHNSSEVKHLSLGSADYRFEKVSDNVINLFISRKRKRKPKN